MLWDHTQLYLIMDYVEQDLRQFMDNDPQSRDLSTVKVVTSPLESPRRAGWIVALCSSPVHIYLYLPTTAMPTLCQVFCPALPKTPSITRFAGLVSGSSHAKIGHLICAVCLGRGRGR